MSKCDFGTIKSLLHFDYPYFAEPNDGLDDEIGLETWTLTGYMCLEGIEKPYTSTGSPKFGYRCAYAYNCSDDNSDGITCENTSGIFNLNPDGEYEFECFVKTIELEQYRYKFFGGHTFMEVSGKKTWSNAKEACEALGGHLATSTSAEKNAFLASLASSTGYWLGGTDEETEGVWKWITGEEWNSEVPANDASNYDYLCLKKDGTFTAGSSSATRGYICEWDYDMRYYDMRNEWFPYDTGEMANILNIGDGLKLSITDNLELNLQAQEWSISQTSSARLMLSTWHHILLRLSGGNAKVYLDGALVINASITGSSSITPSSVLLGGWEIIMDEFVFRHSAGSGVPSIPSRPYNGTLDVNSVGGFGNGSDGDITISTANTQINSYGIIRAATSESVFSVSSWSNSTSTDYGRPSVGSEVMIHVTAPRSTTAAIYPNVGLYAFGRIAEIDGSNITLEEGISVENGYDFTLSSELLSAYYVQAITVPNFESLTVNSGATIIPRTWSTTTGGGIVAFRCSGDCTVNGSILVHGCGATRYDLQQMTHSKLIDRFLCGSGGGIFITCGGTFTAPETARLGASWDGSGKGGAGITSGNGGNGGAGYGGGGAGDIEDGGTGSSGRVGGGGGGCYVATSSLVGITMERAADGTGSGGYSLTHSTSAGGTQGITAGGNSLNNTATGGGGAGGNSGSNSTNELPGLAGANIILVAGTLDVANSAISTGGAGGHQEQGTATGGGGTGFCYISCGEQVSENA